MRFPTREADVAALAGNVIVGLTESADDFPAPPVTAADLKTALEDYFATRDRASIAEGEAAEAHGEKDEALQTRWSTACGRRPAVARRLLVGNT